MLHPVARADGEGAVGAAQPSRHRGVADREVTGVELVDRLRLGAGQPRLAQLVPAGRRDRPAVEVDEQAALGVRGQAHAVGVGDPVVLHRAGLGHVDLDLVEVVPVLPAAVARDRPHARRRPAEGDGAQRRGVAAACCEDVHRHAARGGGPQGQGRGTPAPGRAEPAPAGPGIDLVDDAGGLDAGGGDERTSHVERRDDELALEQPSHRAGRQPRQAQRIEGRQVGELPAQAARQAVGVERQRQRGPADHLPAGEGHPAVGRRVEPDGARLGVVAQVPCENPLREPVRTCFGAEGTRRVVSDHVGRVVVGERHRATRRPQRDVGPAGRSTGTVVLVPAAVQRHLVRKGAHGHVERGPPELGRPVDRRQPGLRALRLPVAGAAELRLQRPDERHHRRRRRVVGHRRHRLREQHHAQHRHQRGQARRTPPHVLPDPTRTPNHASAPPLVQHPC